MACAVCGRDHLIGDPCKPPMPPGYIGIKIDLLKIPSAIRWLKKKVKTWKASSSATCYQSSEVSSQ
jgi:hypothetical protein